MGPKAGVEGRGEVIESLAILRWRGNHHRCGEDEPAHAAPDRLIHQVAGRPIEIAGLFSHMAPQKAPRAGVADDVDPLEEALPVLRRPNDIASQEASSPGDQDTHMFTLAI